MRVLVVDPGGRGHAICWKLAQSPQIKQIYAAPGNPGVAALAQCVPIGVMDVAGLLAFAKKEGIDLVAVGSENTLGAGLTDVFADAHIMVAGPSQAAAELELSKSFALKLMRDHGIPTAEFDVCTNRLDAYVKAAARLKRDGIVWIKADGFAAGQGAIKCTTMLEVKQAVDDILVHHKYGQQKKVVVMRDLGEGEEASLFFVSDGTHVKLVGTGKDHKRLLDHNQGPNTGGMAAYTPVPFLSDDIIEQVWSRIAVPVIRTMKHLDRLYKGILYVGIIMTPEGPKVVEFNVRWGDPETQAILPVMEADLLEIFLAICQGRVHELNIPAPRRAAVGIVLAAANYGYGDPEIGQLILGLERLALWNDLLVFHGGTRWRTGDSGKIETASGRVVTVVGLGDDLHSAAKRVYQAVPQIYFDGMQYRRDILR